MWGAALAEAAQLATENGLIHVAEMIICDETRAHCARTLGGVSQSVAAAVEVGSGGSGSDGVVMR